MTTYNYFIFDFLLLHIITKNFLIKKQIKTFSRENLIPPTVSILHTGSAGRKSYTLLIIKKNN